MSLRDTANQVSLFDPDNIKVNPQATTSMSIIFQIMNPKPGRYQLTFPNTVGQYEYNVQGVSEKAIEFTTSFIHQQSVLKNSPPISITSPFKGQFIYSDMNLLQLSHFMPRSLSISPENMREPSVF